MKQFFYPRSICIAGASAKIKSIGYEILKSIKNYGYNGKVFPVNPKAETILGYQCFQSIREIKDEIDLAIVVVPKRIVNDTIDELIDQKVKSVILITAGFKETGEEGRKYEEMILNKFKLHGMRLVGPNCMGIINSDESIRLNATFVAEKPLNGGIGFLSQSGALGAAVLNSIRETEIKLAQFISIGNKSDVSEHDVLDFWMTDKNVNTITFYLESIENGLELIKSYKKYEKKKPLIILKSGKTESGMKAASSHTGALSSNEKITDALLKQFGIIRADTLNEMFNTAKGFENFPIPRGNRIAVVTNAGGPAILTVDALDEKNLILSSISDKVKSRLAEIVHPEGSINNPVDLLPAATPDIYKNVVEIILDDNNIDAVISIFVEPVMVDAFEVIESVNSVNTTKPVYQVCMPLPEFWQNYSHNSKFKKPIFRNPEDPVKLISNVLHFEEKKNKDYDFNDLEYKKKSGVNDLKYLNQEEIKLICRDYQIPLVKQEIKPADAIKAGKQMSYPLVLKALSEKVVHKSELDAVKLNIRSDAELKQAIDEIESAFNKVEIPIEQYLVQPYVKVKHELLLGGFRDPAFGPIVMFGSGGKYVEVLNDIEIKSAYLQDEDIDRMIEGTKIGKILCGVRGEKGIDMKNLKNIIKSVSRLMIDNEKIFEIDINPLSVNYNNALVAVDIRIKGKIS